MAVGTFAVLPRGHGATPVTPPPSPTARASQPSPTPGASFSPGHLPAGDTDPNHYVPATGGDPLVVEATFGWQPDWAGAGLSYEATSSGESRTQLRGGGQNGPRITLVLHALGFDPASGGYGRRDDAPPVDGRPASWVYSGTQTPGAGAFGLLWRTESGRWAELQADFLTGPDAQPTMERVAAGVRVSAVQVPLPVRIPGLPADFRPTYSALTRPGPSAHAWELDLSFDADSTHSIALSVRPITSPAGGGSSSDGPDGPGCVTRQGVRVCVAAPHGDAMLAEVGGESALLERIQLLGTDETHWTKEVLG
ncbi:hypothetical protein GCM10009665_76400 [Kitasatospora nipponensis]|uniref:Uncharacterized protein n=1 Tax=Kitasatospora nipponensis TaxID=258049 RepID=A0ABN1T9I4_9ACTN